MTTPPEEQPYRFEGFRGGYEPLAPPPTQPQQALPPEPPPNRKRRWPWILLALLAALILVAVGVGIGRQGIKNAVAPAAPSFSRTMPTPAPSPPAPPAAAVKHFGDAARFADGLAVTVAAPQPFTPSDVSSGWIPGQQAATFAITITNGSQQAYDPSLLIVSVRSGANEESQIFDKGLDGTPSTAVLPGQSVTFPVGFTMSNPGAVVVQVTPGFQYTNALFTN